MEELGVPYELHSTLPQTRGVKKYNPAGKVPVLIETSAPSLDQLKADDKDSNNDDDPPFILAESMAINNYLGDKYSSGTLVPTAGTKERALYDQTILFLMSELDAQALWVYRKHTALGRYFGHVPEMEQPCRNHFEQMNQVLSNQLKQAMTTTTNQDESSDEGGFLLGNQFTAADILYVHCLDWAKVYGWHETYPTHVVAYLDRCHGRPAYQRAKALRDQSQNNNNNNNKTPPPKQTTDTKTAQPDVGEQSRL